MRCVLCTWNLDELTLVHVHVELSVPWLFDRVMLADTCLSLKHCKMVRMWIVLAEAVSGLSHAPPSLDPSIHAPVIYKRVHWTCSNAFNGSCSPSLRCYAPFLLNR